MNSSKASGITDQVKGKIKQGVGEAVGNQELANSGAADQVKGHVKETWGNVKDAAKDVGTSESARADTHAQHEGHSVRESVTSAAATVKDSVKRGLDNLENKSRK